MSKWKVITVKTAAKEIEKAPDEIQASYRTWKNIIVESGIMAMRRIPGYYDHALKGGWKGFNSSSLNDKWRVIYRCDGKNVTVTVARVSAHDYR
jgi:addiction module RelE/StbE family toxin